MKKKLLGMLLCATMVASLVVGCGAKEEADTPAATGEVAATEETETEEATGWVPEKDISFVVCFGAGDGSDLTARALVESMNLPVNVVVENITGASGTIGAQEALSRGADGYTLTFLSPANALSQPILNDTLTYTLEDWRPIQLLCSPIIATLACNTDMGLKTSDDLKTFFESGENFTVGVPSMNGFDYIAASTMFLQMGIYDQVTYVPYDGAANLYQGYLAGEVDFAAFDDMFAAQYVEAGDDISVLLTIDSERSLFFPDTVCAGEWGIEGLDANKCMWVVGVPADTPDEVCEYLTEKVNEAILDEAYVAWSDQNNHAPYTDLYEADELMDMLLAQRDAYAEVFRKAGLEVIDYK